MGFDVAGADSAGTVTVAKSGGPTDTATRHGQYFFDAYALTNTSTPNLTTLTITGSGTATLPAYVEKTPQALTYDDDGNLLTDGRWNFTYDGENRPITAETTTAAVTAGVTRQKLTLGYDYLGRRIVKGRESGWNGTAYTVYDFWNRYLYHGWNVVAQVDGNSGSLPITANYFWGLDLSGSLGGAGGVGGLLLVQEGGNSYLPAYDALGNVHAMIKASTGSIDAAYEYDAFGNTLRESGTYAASNPFRFSTKFTDVETGLVYYGLRYYSPTLGRFLNKDPIAEQGGLNLYAFCGNNGVNRWDYLGMWREDGRSIKQPIISPDEVRKVTGYEIVTLSNGDRFVGIEYSTRNGGRTDWVQVTSGRTGVSDFVESTRSVDYGSNRDFGGGGGTSAGGPETTAGDNANPTGGGVLRADDVLELQKMTVTAPNSSGNAPGSTLNALWRAGGAIVNATTTTANALTTAGRAVVNNTPVMGTNLNAVEFAQAVAQGGTYGFDNNVALGGSITYTAPPLGFVAGGVFGEASISRAGGFQRDGGTTFAFPGNTPVSLSGGFQFTFPVSGGDTFARASLSGGAGPGGGADFNFTRDGRLSSISLTIGFGFGWEGTLSAPFYSPPPPPPKNGPPGT